MTNEEKLAWVEEMIETVRWARSTPAGQGDGPLKHYREAYREAHRNHQVLKALAADLRARTDAAPAATLLVLDEQMERVMATKCSDGCGYDRSALVELGCRLVGRWPVVRQALEQFEAAAAEHEELTRG